MRHHVTAFSINLAFNPFPTEDIPAYYALHDIEVLTLVIIYASVYDFIQLQERVLLVAIEGGAEAGVFRETFDEKLQEGVEVRVGIVGVRQLRYHAHQMIVSDLAQCDYLKQEVAVDEYLCSIWVNVIGRVYVRDSYFGRVFFELQAYVPRIIAFFIHDLNHLNNLRW